jgi:plasmid stability protein
VRTTIRIDDDLYRRVKARAARQGRTVGELIEDAVRVAMSPRRSPAGDIPALPRFGAGGPLPGVDLSDNRALAAVMDEGTAVDALR